jgi:hypothetical protein
MGFYLRCAIAKVDDSGLADRICATATESFPSFVRCRRFDAPFAGVIAGYDPVATSERIVESFAAHGYPDEEAATEDVEGAIWNHMGELTLAFPELPFAYIDVDCFGGTCVFSGFIIKDGLRTHTEPSSSSAHVKLFAHLGVVDPQWHFAPFTRGFMETGVAADLSRLPMTYSVHARWDEPYRLAAMRAAMLPSPWKVTVHSEKGCVIVHGEQFYASLHPVDDQVEMRGKSFVELTLTKTLAHELADDDVALELRDPDGKPL